MIAKTEFKNLPAEEQGQRLETLAAVALENYGISKESPIELMKYRENAVFKVNDKTSGKQYAIRVHRPEYQTEQTIQSELMWMDALRQENVRTPSAVKGIDGNPVQLVSVEGVPEARYCTLINWVQGAPMSDDNPTETFEQLGTISASCHKQVKKWKLPKEFKRQKWDEEGMFGQNPLWGNFREVEAMEPEQLELLRQAKDHVIKRLKSYGKSPDRFGLIHGDLMAENVFIQEGQPSLIDFDDSGFGWFMYDLATLIALNIPDPEDARVAVKAWVKGYRTIEPLPDEVLDELPTFIMCRYLVGLGWMHSRKETPMAQEFTVPAIHLACAHAQTLLAG